MSSLIQSQANAVLSRRAYLRQCGTAQLSDFAAVAINALLPGGPVRPGLSPADMEDLKQTVEEQLRAQGNLPAGTRLPRAAHHPAKVLIDLHEGRTCHVPMRVPDILAWLREITGWDPAIDDVVAIGVGVSLPLLARTLTQVGKTDPNTFFALIGFHFDHPDLDHNIRCDPVARPDGERRRPFHDPQPLMRKMMLVAEWARAVEIAKYNDIYRWAQADMLLPLILGRQESDRRLDPRWKFDPRYMIFSVPTLYQFLCNPNPSAAELVDEVTSVLTPPPRSGPKSRGPLVHFYGLEAAELLAVAFLDLVRSARGIPPGSNAIYSHGPGSRHSEDFSDERLTAVIENTLANCGISGSLKHDSGRKARSLRQRYARASVVYGSGYRFDPRFWLQPTRDARLFERLASEPVPGPGDSGARPDTFVTAMTLTRDLLQTLFRVTMDSDDVPEGSEAVAHLMSSATVLTRDPTLFALLDHAMRAGGYKARRGAGTAAPLKAHSRGAGRNWGCILPVTALKSRRYPDMPWAGSEREFPRWPGEMGGCPT